MPRLARGGKKERDTGTADEGGEGDKDGRRGRKQPVKEEREREVVELKERASFRENEN